MHLNNQLRVDSEVAITFRLQLHFPITQHYKWRTVQETWMNAQPEGSRIALLQIDTLRCQVKELEHKGGQR